MIRLGTARLVIAAVLVTTPLLAFAGSAGTTKDLVLDFERSGVLKDLLGKTLAIAKSFLFLSGFLAYAIEAFGRSPVAGRDYAAVTWRLVIVLFLLWNYQAVFGGVIGLIDGLSHQVAPASTWRAFVDEAGDMRKALQDVAAHGEQSASGAAGGAPAKAPSMMTSWVYDALIACVQLLAEAAVFIVNWLSRILSATLFVIGPLALVAAIPRPSGTGTRWFVRFVTIASWPVFSGVLLSVLVTLGAQGALRRTYLECLVGALVMLVTALATPLLASHVIGGALENAASHGYGAAKTAQRDAVRPAVRLLAGAAGGVAARVAAVGGTTSSAGAGGGSSGAVGGGSAPGGAGPAAGGGARPAAGGGGGAGGTIANSPGGTRRAGGGAGRRARGAASAPQPQLPGGAGAPVPTAPAQGVVVANPPAPSKPGPKPGGQGGGGAPPGGPTRA
jgi:hypothetical protein